MSKPITETTNILGQNGHHYQVVPPRKGEKRFTFWDSDIELFSVSWPDMTIGIATQFLNVYLAGEERGEQGGAIRARLQMQREICRLIGAAGDYVEGMVHR